MGKTRISILYQKMLKQIEFLKNNPRFIFLTDGLGAIFSASMLGLVLAQMESTFGIPKKSLYLLSMMAISFSIYSLSCYLFNPSGWKFLLRIIAIANLLYCVSTIFLIFYYKETISSLGVLYFIIEKIVVISLATFEFKATLNKDKGIGSVTYKPF